MFEFDLLLVPKLQIILVCIRLCYERVAEMGYCYFGLLVHWVFQLILDEQIWMIGVWGVFFFFFLLLRRIVLLTYKRYRFVCLFMGSGFQPC